MSKIIAFGIRVNGIDRAASNLGELKALVRDTREQLEAVDPADAYASRRALEGYAAAKRAVRQFNATVRETGDTLEAAAESEGSYRQLQAQVKVLKREFKELAREERRGAAGGAIAQRVRELTAELKSADAELGDYFRNVGDYRGALSDAFAAIDFSALARGDLSGLGDVAQAIDPLRNSIQGLAFDSAGLASAAKLIGPAFALQAAVGLATALTGAVREAVTETRELRRLVNSTTDLGVDTAASDEAIARLRALAIATGQTNDRVFEAASNLAAQFGISIAEAADLLEDARLAGADATGELLDSAREYGAFFSALELDASQFLAVIDQSVEDGVFSDKGVDAIKEAAIALREMPEPAAAALEALGIGRADADFVREREGILGLVLEVQRRLRELPADSEVAGQVLADVFKGAGEDAGEFVREVDLVGQSIAARVDETDRLVRAERDLTAATREVAREQAELERQLGPALDRFTLELTRAKAEALGVFSTLDRVFTDPASLAEGTRLSVILDSLAEVRAAIAGADRDLTALVGGALADLEAAAGENYFTALGRAVGIVGEEARVSAADLRDLRAITEGTPARSPFRDPLASAAGAATLGSGVTPVTPPSGAGADARAEREASAARERAAAAAEREAARSAASAEREAERAADEAARARAALTGLAEVRARITEAEAALAAGAAGAASDEIAARVGVLEAAARAYESAYAGLADRLGAIAPDLDARLREVYEAVRAGRAADEGYGELLADLIGLEEAKALTTAGLERVTAGLASPHEVATLGAQLTRLEGLLAARSSVAPGALQARSLAPVTSDGDPLAAASEAAGASLASEAEAGLKAAEAQADATAKAYVNAANVAGEAFGEFFSQQRQSGAELARAVFETLVASIVQTIRARAFEAFATVAASDPTPIGLARAGLRLVAVNALATSVQALVGSLGAGGILGADGRGGMVRGRGHVPGNRATGVYVPSLNTYVEGGEFVNSRRTVRSRRGYVFEGRVATPAEIISRLNLDHGGAGIAGAARRRGAGFLRDGGVLTPGAVDSITLASANARAVDLAAAGAAGAGAGIDPAALADAVAEGAARGTSAGTRSGAIAAERERELRRPLAA